MGVFRMVRPEYEQIVATVEPPNPDMDPAEITLRFRYLDRHEREEFVASLAVSAEKGKRTSDMGAAGDLLIGWDGIEDEDGHAVEYSSEALVAVYAYPHVARAITEAVKDFLFGVPVRRKKNSPRSAGNGRLDA